MKGRLLQKMPVTLEIRRYGYTATDGSENVIRYLYAVAGDSETCIGRIHEEYAVNGDAERVERTLREAMVRDIEARGAWS
jgi:hypothetical protein